MVECSVGIDRLFLTILFDAYYEDAVEGESRIALKLKPNLAPYKAAFMPLTKQQVEPMTQIFKDVQRKGYSVQYDLSGSIGKRYRRQDEIGTPLCFTYDFDSPTDGKVTVRHRDTMNQERIAIESIEAYIREMLRL